MSKLMQISKKSSPGLSLNLKQQFAPVLLLSAMLPLGLFGQGFDSTTPAKEYVRFAGQVVAVELSDPNCRYVLSGTGQTFTQPGGNGQFTVTAIQGCAWMVTGATSWISITGGASGNGNGTVSFSVTSNPTAQQRTTVLTVGNQTFSIVQAGTLPPPSGWRFVPITPCRVADTRLADGPLGGPYISGQTSRDFPVLSSSCGVPATAKAYSLNVTVLPDQPLTYLKIWPSGRSQPDEATVLNSYDGRIKANAAIVAAGSGGAVTIFASDDTDAALDINGYFTDDAQAMYYYPLVPCRVADTRTNTGAYLSAGSTRNFLVSGNCNLPANAQAYLLNLTAVPHSSLSFLTAWPAGQSRPGVSTLNAPTGTIAANAAVVAAGSSGQIAVYTTDDTDLVVDISGYFAQGSSGLSFYPLAPCRAYDSRTATGTAFNGTMAVNIQGSGCGAPNTAQTYLLNATVLPSSTLTFLRLWADGTSQPVPAVLNALDGEVTSNMAVVQTLNGLVDAYATNPTELILDISGYFAP